MCILSCVNEIRKNEVIFGHYSNKKRNIFGFVELISMQQIKSTNIYEIRAYVNALAHQLQHQYQ